MGEIAEPLDTVQISEELIRRFDRSGPRYTSYPTADRFQDDFSSDHYITALTHRQQFVSPPPYSLYVHLPFCASPCYFCACNKIITQDQSRSRHYVDTVLQELQLLAPYLGEQRLTGQLHLGGGTPTFLPAEELKRLMQGIQQQFHFEPSAELGIEIDPRTVNAETLSYLAELGFNRTSFGVQDFHPQVQQAINRVQPLEMVEMAMAASRAAGFESINTDLIYGLPNQTQETFAQTVEALLSLRPDRIALYNYAHLPQRFKAQRLINADLLPSADERLAIFLVAAQRLLDAGCEVLMPWGAPIGTGQGLLNRYNLRTLRDRIPEVPMIIDAGLGAPSQATEAMEMGFDGILLNTAVAKAINPPLMAEAFADAINAGRKPFKAGLMQQRQTASPSTPTLGQPFWHNK